MRHLTNRFAAWALGASALLSVMAACGDEHVFVDAAPGPDAATRDAAATVDAARDGAAAIDAGPITPDGIAGLLAWYDGASGVTGAGWADRSGTGRNLSCVGTPVTTGALNGLPAAHFDGGTFCQLTANVPRFEIDDGVLVAVAMATTTGGGLVSIQDASGNNVVRLIAGTNAQGTIASNTVTAGGAFSDAQPHLFVLARQGGVVSLRVDRTLAMSGGVLMPTVTGGMTMYVGFGHPIIDLGEVLVYRGDISPAQIEGLEGYLAAKFRP